MRIVFMPRFAPVLSKILEFWSSIFFEEFSWKTFGILNLNESQKLVWGKEKMTMNE